MGPSSSPPRAAWRPGGVVDGYRLDAEFPSSGMAQVFLAHDPRTGGPVVVKALPADPVTADDPVDAQQAALRHERFLREVAATRRLVHPDIVRVLGAGQAAGRPYMVLALVRGTDLRRYTVPQRLLPEPLALRVMARVCHALAHAHGLGVLHRDVKPANIVVDLPSMAVTLTDFGISQLSEASRTRTGLIIGTPAYMSPEQLAGARADERSDLYAVGVVLFELLAARLPHEAPSMGALLRAIATDPAPPLDALRPGLPAPLVTLVAQLLEREPARRPAAAAAVGHSLADLAEAWPPMPH